MKRKLHLNTAIRLISLQPGTKLLVVSLTDWLVLSGLALACFGFAWPAPASFGALFCGLAPAVTILVLFAIGVYRTVVRFLTAEHFLRLIGGVIVSATSAAILCGKFSAGVPAWSPVLLYATGGATLLAIVRGLAARFLRPALYSVQQLPDRAIIFGAGTSGTQLAAALQTSGRFQPVAFVDSRTELQGRSLLGLPVYGPEYLPALKASNRFDQILLAIPSINGVRRRELLESLAPLATKVMVVPSLENLASGRHRLDELHEVQIEDLLSRESVEPNRHLLELHIRGKTVLVTGAAGTIGAELCKQAIEHGANKLIMLDHSEYGLYTAHQNLRESAFKGGCEVVTVLGSVADYDLLLSVMHSHVVDSIYHAAAYKHVSLVEQNVLASVANNVFGTLEVARAAVHCGVRNFVLVSTDKAVRPSSIMGASKRICELIIQALARRQTNTCNMSIVRFGNVLASSGSVIPLFEKQIRDGGPVTVTHPDVTRYFMTISEAAQLVIQAGALGSNGDVFVLDMGQPIKIMELAERMIRLSGLEVRSPERPNGDIAIEIIGLRSGEKLHEELFIGEQPEPTSHPRIFKASERFIDLVELEARLHSLRASIASGNVSDVVWAVHQLARDIHAGEVVPPVTEPRVTALPRSNLRVIRDSGS